MNNKEKLWTKDFILMMVIALLIFNGFQVLLPTLPIYVKSLGSDDSVIGWIIGVVTISSLLMRPFSGIILDKVGRRGVLLAGMLINIAATLLYNWFPVAGVIIAIRFVHGLGWGAGSTAAITAATDIIPVKRFGEGVGYYSLSSSLSMALAPGIGISVLAAFGFSNLVLVSVAFWVLAFLLSFFVKYKKVERCEKSKIKVILFEKSSLKAASVMVLVGTTYGLITGFISVYAGERGIENIGLFFFVFAGVLLISRPVLGRIIDTYGFGVVIYPGFAIMTASMVLLSASDSLVLFLVSGLLYGLGFGAVHSSLHTMAVLNAPRDHLGAANATFLSGFDAGIGVGSILAGIVAARLGYSLMYLSFSSFLVLAFLLYLFFSLRQRRQSVTSIKKEGFE